MLFAVSSITLAAQIPQTQITPTEISIQPEIRLTAGRFTVIAAPSEARLARTLLAAAQSNDSFPGLPRPVAPALIAIAPDARHFRDWVGSSAPEWGAAIAIPELNRIIMQGASAGSDAGDPLVVLRHELAHLALHERMDTLPPRWFDEGYASVSAGEWSRETAFETSLALAWRAMPGIETLDDGFTGGATRAEWSYALAHRAVAELQAIDTQRGLSNFFAYWRESGSMDVALRRAFGLTTDGFDAYWHKATQRRYGAFAIAANLSVAFGVFAVALGPLFWLRLRRNRRRLEAMRLADAAQEAALRASALAAMLALDDEPLATSDPQATPRDPIGTPSLDTTWRAT